VPRLQKCKTRRGEGRAALSGRRILRGGSPISKGATDRAGRSAAGRSKLVQLAVTLGVYDNRCEKLAPRLLADVQRMVRMLDKDDVMAGVINEQDNVDRAGEATWCVALPFRADGAF
jgi:hypothetical protein